MHKSKSAWRQGLILLLVALQQHSCVCGFVPTVGVSRAQNPGFGFSWTQPESWSTTPLSSSSSNEKEKESVWGALLDRFQGDFDNYDQVVTDRSEGLLPREGGGHEHIHCCLVPVNADSRLAAFYFDGAPGAIFRFRYYHLVPTDKNDMDSSSSPVDTVLYTLHPDLEKQLRLCPDPAEWPTIFHNFPSSSSPPLPPASSPPSSQTQQQSQSETQSQSQTQQDRITLLEACDVRWSWERDPIQHAYAAAVDDDDGSAMHAVMVHGSATVSSQMMPGQEILIKDQLSLWQDSLWIHDRGYNPVTGAFIYGNQRGVPYTLARVTSVVQQPDNSDDNSDNQSPCQRVVVDPSLAWTLGPDFRTLQEYEEKMAVIGGSSRPAR